MLAEVLPQCLALNKLELGNNDIGDDGVEMLAGALPWCSALNELDLNRI
jgi:hypothetical protein